MNHITNHYKNKCEILQEKINVLKNQLNLIREDMQVSAEAGPSATQATARTPIAAEMLRPSDRAPAQLGGGPTPPPPPAGAPPNWVARWNYVFNNWNNWNPNQTNSTPGAYLGWLLGQWGNPSFGNWG